MNSIDRFGGALMTPNIAGQSFNFSLLARLHRYFGFTSEFIAADNIWQLDSLTTIDASPIIAKLGLYFRPFDFDIENKKNKIDFTLNFYFTHRAIQGDFNNDTRVIGEQEITPRGYNGIDISANLYLNEVQLFFQVSSNSKGAFDIPGFTGTQVSIGLNVTGDFITID